MDISGLTSTQYFVSVSYCYIRPNQILMTLGSINSVATALTSCSPSHNNVETAVLQRPLAENERSHEEILNPFTLMKNSLLILGLGIVGICFPNNKEVILSIQRLLFLPSGLGILYQE